MKLATASDGQTRGKYDAPWTPPATLPRRDSMIVGLKNNWKNTNTTMSTTSLRIMIALPLRL